MTEYDRIWPYYPRIALPFQKNYLINKIKLGSILKSLKKALKEYTSFAFCLLRIGLLEAASVRVVENSDGWCSFRPLDDG